MYKRYGALSLLLLAGLSGTPLPAEEAKEQTTAPNEIVSWHEDFSKAEKDAKGVLKMPDWAVEATRFGVPATNFFVAPEKDNPDNLVLVIDCRNSTGAYICNPSDQVDLNKTPIMRWRWRVDSLPLNADGRDKTKDDQPVAIYIGANAFIGKRSIAYRWENETPIGFSGTVKYGGGLMKVKFIVVENKETPLNTWIVEERNVAEDFIREYGVVPDEFAVTVCGNSQYTKSTTRAEIDYIEFVSKPEEKKQEEKSGELL